MMPMPLSVISDLAFTRLYGCQEGRNHHQILSDGAKAVKWTCDGSPEFTIEDTDKAERGTDIVLYIDDDCKEFLEEARISSLLKKYCSFLPVPVAFGKKKDGKTASRLKHRR